MKGIVPVGSRRIERDIGEQGMFCEQLQMRIRCRNGSPEPGGPAALVSQRDDEFNLLSGVGFSVGIPAGIEEGDID